MAELNKRKEK
jgi:hypothetical protein